MEGDDLNVFKIGKVRCARYRRVEDLDRSNVFDPCLEVGLVKDLKLRVVVNVIEVVGSDAMPSVGLGLFLVRREKRIT